MSDQHTVPTITLTATELRDLVASVTPHTSTDGTLTLLCSVRVTVRDGRVLAASTDRYSLAFNRVRPAATPDPEFAAIIPTAVLARIQSIFKPTRLLNPQLALSVEDDVLTVRSLDGLDGITVGASLAFALHHKPADYPKIDGLLHYALTHPAETTPSMRVTPAFLASFKVGQPIQTPLEIAAAESRGGPRVQWLIRCGEDFIGLLVPVFGAPLPAPDGWLALLDAPSDQKVEDAA